MSNLSTYFPILLTAAPIILFFQQSKGVALKIFRIFWKERIVPLNFSVEFYKELVSKSINFNFDDYEMEDSHRFSSKHNKYLPIVFKLYKFELCLYRYIIPIFLFGTKSGGIKIQYLKFTFNFEKYFNKIINEKYLKICEDLNKYEIKTKGFYIATKRGQSLKGRTGSSSDNQSQNTLPAAFDGNRESANKYPIIGQHEALLHKFPRTVGINIKDVTWDAPLSKQNKYIFTKQGEYLLSQVTKWLKAENWYQEKDIRWYRGAALIGYPGTGKSALVLEIARTLKMPIFIFDLQSFDNQEFEKALKDLPYDSAIILFEDIDAVYNGRENLTKSDEFGGLTFDFFINKLSGVDGIRNKFVFITTNHIEKLDPALTRDGRIDEVIEINSLNSEEKIKMASVILENNKDLINQVMENSDNLSTAQFENKCVQLALNEFWSN